MTFILRMAGRELRSHKARFVLLATCTALGVVAFTATAGFSESVRGALQEKSRQLLGADFAMSSVRPLPEELVAAARETEGVGASSLVTDTVTLAQARSTTIGAEPATRLVEVRAADDAYPLLGELRTAPPLAISALNEALFVEAPLARAWKLRVASVGTPAQELFARGEAMRVAGRIVPIAAIVEEDSGREASAFTLGPRLYLSRALAAALGILSEKSRLRSKLLLRVRAKDAMAPADAMAMSNWLRALGRHHSPAVPVRVQSFEDPPGNLVRPVRNLNLFLDQIGLATLLLCVLGGWMALASYLRSKERDVAVLRCLGASPRSPSAIYGTVALAVTALAMLAGVSGGLLVGAAFPRLLESFLPSAIAGVSFFLPPGLDLAAAGAMILLLALPPIAALQAVSPLGILRQDARGEGNAALGTRFARRILPVASTLLALLLGAFLVLRRAPSGPAGFAIVAALVVLGVILVTANAGLVALLRRLQSKLPLSMRLAASELGARRSLSGLTMGVLGAAVFLGLIAEFTRDDLLAPLQDPSLAGGRPNVYFVDVQPDQLEVARGLLRAEIGNDGLHAPVVRARLQSIAGVPVAAPPGPLPPPRGGGGDVPDQGGDTMTRSSDGRAMRTREQNLTYRDALADGESLVAGTFWKAGDPDPAQWSLEARFADRIGAKLGDALIFDVQGVPISGRVTSLRKVTWQNLRPNFFIVAPAALLGGAPHVSFLAALVLAEDARERLQAAATEKLPNVTVIDGTLVARRLGEVLDVIARVTQLLAYLMLASSLSVLAASVLASRRRRARGMAILRTLGARGGLLGRALVAEFTLLGGIGGGIGALLAFGSAQIYVGSILDLPSRPSPLTAALAVLMVTALSLVVGAAGLSRVLRAKPLTTLRGD